MDHLEGGLGKGDLKERKVDQNSFSTDVLCLILGLDTACGLNRPFPSSPQSHFDGARDLSRLRCSLIPFTSEKLHFAYQNIFSGILMRSPCGKSSLSAKSLL